MKISPLVWLDEVGADVSGRTEGAISLAQLPSSAFGDGTHPTTRLCAGAVDFLCRQRVREAVLDVGTGTGVLARIARARSARFVAGTDIDLTAIAAARGNAALDLHAQEIEFTNVAPDHWGPRFDLVVANILEGPLRELMPALARSLSPEAVLLLSGFTRLQVPILQTVFSSLGLECVSESSLENWALLGFVNGRGK